MSDTKDDKEVVVPGTTEALLPFLQQLYPVEELQAFIRKGDLPGAQRHQAQIDLINEVIELWNEQKKRGNEVATKRRRQ